MGEPIELERSDDVDPLCPHCERALTRIGAREIRSTLGKRYIYFCPHCKKALGVSHRKGFWMG